MNKILEKLHFSWSDEDSKEMPVYSRAMDELCENKSNLKTVDKELILSNAIADEKINAFAVGFNAAVQLLMGGGLS